ncbi:hypothetical protein LDDCCGHA_4965 [Methylobacterium oxalidis]|nr:hypothetical protein LDDCCGHA_4965 [Methylobacterium oxalidis]
MERLARAGRAPDRARLLVEDGLAAAGGGRGGKLRRGEVRGRKMRGPWGFVRLEGAARGEVRRGARVGEAVGAGRLAAAPRVEARPEGGAALHDGLRHGAEGDDAEARLVRIVPALGAAVRAAGQRAPRRLARGHVGGVVLLALLRARPGAAGAGEAEDGDAGVDEADQRRARPRDRPEDGAGGRHQRVARDAAEAGRQRPAGGGRQGARHRARRAEADDPERDPQAALRQVAGPHQAQAPEGRRQREGQRAEAEELHGEVRDHGPGGAQHVVGALVGGVVEARVVDRPRRQRHRQGDGAAEQQEAAELRHPPCQERPQRVDEGVVGRCGAAKRAHAGPGTERER